MDLNISKTVKDVFSMFILLILPILAILLGVVFNVLIAWYFILCVTWFGAGVIFYSAIS
jgi:hypothetical protein